MNAPLVNRVVLIVLDSVGIGNAPDAADYGDEGSNTLGHIAGRLKTLALPNLRALGIGNIAERICLSKSPNPSAAYGSAIEKSAGKDTTTGHWEISGLLIEKAFPTFTAGFPKALIAQFESLIGRKTLGNKSASGTGIIEELGAEHVRTGFPIVYTSADSVFQIAAHEDIIPLTRLYEICQIARTLLKGEFAVGRVIARPFTGKDGSFQRTSNRRDFSLKPFSPTVLNKVQDAGLDVIGVGKIGDIFDGYGITKSIHTDNNMDGVQKTLEVLSGNSTGLVFVNLVDFDSQYGHRRDVEGYGKCLEQFDAGLSQLLSSLKKEDVLILTADHGNDPTASGSDHTREIVPILVYGDRIKQGADIGLRKSFADIGATVADMLNVELPEHGESFKNIVLNVEC